MFEREKHYTPIKGEVELKDARAKAGIFASQVKLRLKNKGAKFK